MSIKVKNVSPFGHLDVPLLGRVVEAGEVFEAHEEHAAILLAQPFHYAPGDKPAEAFLKAQTAATDAPEAPATGEGEPE